MFDLRYDSRALLRWYLEYLLQFLNPWSELGHLAFVFFFKRLFDLLNFLLCGYKFCKLLLWDRHELVWRLSVLTKLDIDRQVLIAVTIVMGKIGPVAWCLLPWKCTLLDCRRVARFINVLWKLIRPYFDSSLIVCLREKRVILHLFVLEVTNFARGLSNVLLQLSLQFADLDVKLLFKGFFRLFNLLGCLRFENALDFEKATWKVVKVATSWALLSSWYLACLTVTFIKLFNFLPCEWLIRVLRRWLFDVSNAQTGVNRFDHPLIRSSILSFRVVTDWGRWEWTLQGYQTLKFLIVRLEGLFYQVLSL